MRLAGPLLCLLLIFADSGSAAPAQLARLARGDMAKLSFRHAGQAVPTTVIEGKTGTLKLQSLRGKVVVLNLWATWCAPCLAELPSLDRLAGRLRGSDILVLAVSEDQAGWRAVDPWWRKARLTHLTPQLDKAMDLGFGLGAKGLPLTLIYDRQGREVARLAGTARWDSPAAEAFLRAVAAQK